MYKPTQSHPHHPSAVFVCEAEEKQTSSSGHRALSSSSWWSRRSRLERKLFILTLSSVLVALLMGIAITVLTIRLKLGNVCLKPGCIKSAAEMLERLDQKVNPCDNFYQFSCGNWLSNNFLADDKSSLSLFSTIDTSLEHQLRALLEHQSPNDEHTFIANAKLTYKQCLNETQIDSFGEKGLMRVLESLGGWPVLLKPNATVPDVDTETIYDWWVKTTQTLRKSGYSTSHLVTIEVSVDLKINTRHIIEVGEPSLSLPREYLLQNLNESDTRLMSYYKLMVEAAVYLGADRDFAKQEMLQVLHFERSLANLTVPREEKRNLTRFYNKMPLSQLTSLSPEIRWDSLFEIILNDKFDQSEEIIVTVPTFVRNVQKLVNGTNKRVLSNYILWRTVKSSASYCSKKLRDIMFEYRKAVSGVKQKRHRWKTCVDHTNGHLSKAVSALYVRQHFNKETKNHIENLVNYVKKQFVELLGDVDWMDEKTRNEAKLKAREMEMKVAFPDQLLDDQIVTHFYRNLKLDDKESFFENQLKISKWIKDYYVSFLRQPFDRNDWRHFASVAVVNAYYHPQKNTMQFPAGILQGLFYDKNRPDYLNFGSIGVVVGHEITHGFDDMGKQFDRNGNNINWWQPEADARYRKKAQCIINQYSNYSIKNKAGKAQHLKGINTQGENIADNGGAKESFLAYTEYVKRKGVKELPLPGLPYSPHQLFWISYAHTWCSKIRPKALEMRVETGAHSPPEFRVIGVVSNSEHFAKAFKCPLGSKMNPPLKCSVW